MSNIENIREREFKHLKKEECVELKKLFEENTAFCFIVEKGVGDPSRTRNAAILRRKILKEVPTAILAEIDLCVMSSKSFVAREQFLIIDKEGTTESTQHIGDIIADSEIVDSMIVFYKTVESGYKKCFKVVFSDSTHSAIVKKANLVIDGDHLLLTIRHLTQKDIKDEKECKKK